MAQPSLCTISVSCLMVTHRRPERARVSIDCYLRQTHPFKELVILCDGPATYRDLASHTSTLERPDITIEYVMEGALTLGALRNRAIELASFAYVCQWDDDDLYHPLRLSLQLDAMVAAGGDASLLTDQLLLIEKTRRLYWCDWAQPRARRWPPAIPNTVLCPRDTPARYPMTGPNSRRSEDECFMAGVLATQNAVAIRGLGPAYVYVCHGDNTWPETHHLNLIHVTAMSRGRIDTRRDHLERFVREHHLPWPVLVCDDGDAELFQVAQDRSAVPGQSLRVGLLEEDYS